MSSPFSFIPRSVSKGTKQKSFKDRVPHKQVAHVSQESIPRSSITLQVVPASGIPQPKNPSVRDDELLILMEMALSDYSLWCNPVLQHGMRSAQDGYLPVKHILSQSLFSTLLLPSLESDIMRCIRTSPTSNLETRMLITEPSHNEWLSHSLGGSNSYQPDKGGFEVHRKDWKTALQALAENVWTKEWWDQRTIYIERIPVAYRSITAVARYILSLLRLHGETCSADSRQTLVQSITFPRYHLAPQDKPTRCKGFAFVVLKSPALVDILCQSYPWDSSPCVHSADAEAVKFGTRVLPKTSWEALKTEYLEYQQYLVSQVAKRATETKENSLNLECHPSPRDASLQPETPSQPSWFPRDCLIFVRNIHPDTNKTTLRTLFGSLSGSSKGDIDYVDFTKGIDTCHLRLASPSDAARLLSYFTTQNFAQHDALDQKGSTPTNDRPRIILELVKGKPEELYWEKVPEKVRSAAVTRLQGTSNHSIKEENDSGQRRKRRKKG